MKAMSHFVLMSCTAISTLLFPSVNWAAGAKVEAMQMPAWVERAGIKQALKPGMELNSGDVLTTGSGARMLLNMDDGSLVKMGENASLNLAAMLPPANDKSVFEAAIHVIKGAFRFTTTELAQPRKRTIDVRIGAVTVGIRGTDIWGSATADQDVLCLIEGKINAQREGDVAFIMQNPLSFYIAPKNKPALPIKPVSKSRLAKWAAETETSSGSGVLAVDGEWTINLMSLDNIASAEQAIKLLADEGYFAEIHNFSLNNRDVYRVRITGFKSRKDAQHLAGLMDGKYGIVKPWVAQLQNTPE